MRKNQKLQKLSKKQCVEQIRMLKSHLFIFKNVFLDSHEGDVSIHLKRIDESLNNMSTHLHKLLEDEFNSIVQTTTIT